MGPAGQLRGISFFKKTEIDVPRKEGWDPQVPGPPAKWPANEVARGGMIVM